MKQKTKSIFIIILLVILIALIGISFYGGIVFQTVFPNEGLSQNIKITNQKGELNFLEGDTINPIDTEITSCGAEQSCTTGIYGYMIFINDKLHKISGRYRSAPHYSICGRESTSQIYWENDCGTWQYVYQDLLKCSNDNTCDYAGFNTLGQNKLEAGNNQEVEVIMRLTKNDGGFSSAYNRFKINIAPLPCVFDSNQLLVVQDFRSGSTISKSTLRFPPVKFCSVHPPIIVDSFTKTSYTDLNILTRLNNNADYVVPQDKVVAIFYVANNDPSIPALCSPDDVYNLNSGLCEDVIGFVTVCQEGTFDPSKGICVTQPGIEYVCPEGARYDISLNVCIYNPPVQTICEIGAYNPNTGKCEYNPPTDIICSQGTYNPITQLCEYTPPTSAICPAGTTYNLITNKCEYTPPTAATCSSGFIYNSATNKCEFTPQTAIICSIGTYNSVTNKCEFVPPELAVCSTGIYNLNTGRCEYNPPLLNICLTGTYNSLTNSCEYIPSIAIKCLVGTYDQSTNTCVYTPNTLVKCTGGTYNEQLNACIYQPNLQVNCPQGSTYNSAKDICEKSPGTYINCPSGSQYDSAIDKCIINPDLYNNCPSGFQYNSGSSKCERNPPITTNCPLEFTYNSNTGFCEKIAQAKTICVQGTYDTNLNACKIIPNLDYQCLQGNLTENLDGTKLCTIFGENKYICLSGFNYNQLTGKCEKLGNYDNVPITTTIKEQFSLSTEYYGLPVWAWLIIIILIIWALSRAF